MKRFLILIASAAMLCSCAVTQKLFTSPAYVSAEPQLNARWQGSSYADIVRANGAPTRSAEDGLGGKIYVYEQIYTVYDSESRKSDISDRISTETTARTQRDFTEFYVDAGDKCYLVRSNATVQEGRRFSPVKTLFITEFIIGSVLVAGGAIALLSGL